jgi:hypothetical protein
MLRSRTGSNHTSQPSWLAKACTDMNNQITNFRVIKKLSPAKPGAIKLGRRYGEQLVCVRHRLDPTGNTRVTTVELVVERAPVSAKPDQLVGVKIGYSESQLRAVVKAAGATWDKDSGVWRMPIKMARLLNLRERITEK